MKQATSSRTRIAVPRHISAMTKDASIRSYLFMRINLLLYCSEGECLKWRLINNQVLLLLFIVNSVLT